MIGYIEVVTILLNKRTAVMNSGNGQMATIHVLLDAVNWILQVVR